MGSHIFFLPHDIIYIICTNCLHKKIIFKIGNGYVCVHVSITYTIYNFECITACMDLHQRIVDRCKQWNELIVLLIHSSGKSTEKCGYLIQNQTLKHTQFWIWWVRTHEKLYYSVISVTNKIVNLYHNKIVQSNCYMSPFNAFPPNLIIISVRNINTYFF